MHTSKVRTGKPWSMEWLYNIGLAHRIKQYIVQHNLVLSKHAELDMASIAQSTTIEHLDERVVCKLFGFEAAEDYYTAASSMQYIPQIRTPCLFLIAQDDPFLGRLPIEVSTCHKAPRQTQKTATGNDTLLLSKKIILHLNVCCCCNVCLCMRVF